MGVAIYLTPLVFLAMFLNITAAIADDMRDAPSATVDYLLSLPHGPGRTNEEGRELLKLVRQSPEQYRDAIKEHLKLPADTTLLTSTAGPATLKLGRALMLAQTLGKEQGGAIVREFHAVLCKELAEVLQPTTKPMSGADAESRSQYVVTLRHLERTVLGVMTIFEDPAAVSYTLQTIENQEPATRIVMLQYLAAVAKLDDKVQPRLQDIVDKTTSPLHGDPIAREVLSKLKRINNGKDGGP
jgi:hypothetical protein